MRRAFEWLWPASLAGRITLTMLAGLLAIHLGLVLGAPSLGLTTGEAVRICLATAGLWWGAFTVFTVSRLRNRPVREVAGRPAVLQEQPAGLPAADWPAEAAVPGVWLRLVTEATSGLSVAHAAGLAHGRLTADSVWLDPAGRVTRWNEAGERLFGWTTAECVGRSGADLFTPEDRAAGAPEQEIGLARRRADLAALVPAWARAREALVRHPVDLWTLLPLGEVLVGAALLGEADRLAAIYVRIREAARARR